MFHDVQSRKIFADSKLFVDCVPRTDPAELPSLYEAAKNQPGFSLERFVHEHFELPENISSGYVSGSKPLPVHIEDLWHVLQRTPNARKGTLIDLPYPYIVPGGRFREIFYWDTYFTMLGLAVSNHWEVIENMVKNFAYVIHTIGYIPNGNRTYFISRSQPPYFALMVELLAGKKGELVYQAYLPALEKEYAFWMDGAEQLSKENYTYRRTVRMEDGTVLNRYWDDQDTIRPEAYAEDRKVVELSKRKSGEIERDLRAACESGWDFSSRWQQDGMNRTTIETVQLVPVDLNCLLYQVEVLLAKIYNIQNNQAQAALFHEQAEKRKAAILRYCWDEAKGFFVDYHHVQQRTNNKYTLAGVYPLFAGLCTPDQALAVKNYLEANAFLQLGGWLTTTIASGEQWDAPNGWAPLQWTVFKALQNYGFEDLANDGATRWLLNNEQYYARTGKMMEKYNVMDVSEKAGGGKYPNQDGFGWTNGVYLALKQEIEQRIP